MKLLLAASLSLFGFYIIYAVWKQKTDQITNTTLPLIIGWALAITSIFLMVNTYGLEYGLTYALFGFAVIPFGISLVNLEIRNSNHFAAKQSQRLTFLSRNTALNIVHFIIVVPVCGIFSLVSTLLISQTFPWQTVNQLAFVVVIFPLVWACTAYAYLYSEKRKASAIKLISLTFVSTLLASL